MYKLYLLDFLSYNLEVLGQTEWSSITSAAIMIITENLIGL